VGIVDDVRHGRVDQEAGPEILVDYRQMLAVQDRWNASQRLRELLALGFMSFAARVSGDPAAYGPAVRSAVLAADPSTGIDAMAPLEDLLATSVARPRFYATMLGFFALVAAVLAAIGVYGLLSYSVAQRTREIGVRMSLGARPRALLGAVLGRGLLLTAAGIGVGLAAGAGLSRTLSSLLYGVVPLDPTTYALVAAGFAAIALVASYLPGRRAIRVDPVTALRVE
jgi:putative ABC transport system permease protein